MKQLDPKMVERQIVLIKRNFSNYSSDTDTEARVKKAVETGIWPLVDHISSFGYPREFIPGMMKLAQFPFGAEEKDKWLNVFSSALNDTRMMCFHDFTEEEADQMNSSLGEIMNALHAMKAAIPFINMKIEDNSDRGIISLIAIDRLKEEHNLVKSIGNTD